MEWTDCSCHLSLTRAITILTHRPIERVARCARSARSYPGSISKPVDIAALVLDDPGDDPGPLRLPVDPVCRMAVDPMRFEERTAYHGTAYYFCSTTCPRLPALPQPLRKPVGGPKQVQRKVRGLTPYFCSPPIAKARGARGPSQTLTRDGGCRVKSCICPVWL